MSDYDSVLVRLAALQDLTVKQADLGLSLSKEFNTLCEGAKLMAVHIKNQRQEIAEMRAELAFAQDRISKLQPND